MLPGTGPRAFTDELELQHVNFSLSPHRNDCKAGRSEPEPACRLPSPLLPKHTNHPTALRLPFVVTPCAGRHVWPAALHRAAGLVGHSSSWERAAGQGCHTLLGHDSQREPTGGSPALCLCSAISVPGSAAQAVLATLPCGFILTRGQGRAGC